MKRHRPIVLALASSLVFACGGSVSSSSGTSGSAGSAGSSGSSGRSCTELGCDQGLRIDFSYKQQGTYVVVVNVDGRIATCKATLPLTRDPVTPCDDPSVLLTLVGSMLPVDQQSIGGVYVRSTTARSVIVRVQRDNAVIAEATYAPPPYVTRPGPNGPGCEPAECTQATVTLGARPQAGFPCGSFTCNVGADYCEKASQNGAPSPSYACVIPSGGQASSTGGPLESCSATDCPCIERRAKTSRCAGGATCALVDGNAFVTCSQGG